MTNQERHERCHPREAKAWSPRARSLAAMATALFAGSVLAEEPAELILTGGQIYTPAGWQDALAVRGGTIVAVGKTAEVAAHRGAQTNVVDLAGRAVFPGLHDM